ncbi:MAG TPA: hypothetical protein VGF59_37130 [Bryobacteraceae bacterium]|jgi:hypothetical protein
MNEWELIELLGGAVVIVLAGWWLRHLLRFPIQMSLFDICIGGTAFFAGSGPWLGFIYGKGKLPVEDGVRLFVTFAIILTYIATLVLIGYMAHRGFSRSGHTSIKRADFTIASLSAFYNKISPSFVLITLCGVWALRIIIGAVYGQWASNGGTEEDGVEKLPYMFYVVYSLSSALASGCLLWSSRVFWMRPRSSGWGIALIILILELAWAFTIGRRPMFGWLVFVAVGYFSSGNTLQIKHVFVGAIFLFCFAIFLFPLFQRVRYYRYLPQIQSQNALSRYFTALEMALTNSDNYSEHHYHENMAERPLLHRFICRIKEKQETHEVMGGEAFWTSFVKVIPGVIMSNKIDMPVTEVRIQEWYGLPNSDMSNTWPATGCADFGLLGGVMAGLGMGGVIWLSELMARAAKRSIPFVSLCCVGTMIDVLYQFEIDPTASWVTLRALLLLTLGGWILRFFSKMKSRDGEVRFSRS